VGIRPSDFSAFACEVSSAGHTSGCATAYGRLPALEFADHSLSLVVEGGDDLVGVLFRIAKSQAADRKIDDFMTVPRSHPA
jgi:hypothetical protein